METLITQVPILEIYSVLKNSDAFQQYNGVYHDLVRGLESHPDQYPSARRLVYLLNYRGGDVNFADEDGNTALHKYLASTAARECIVEALLQCNADLYLQNKEGKTPLMVGLTNDAIRCSLQNLARKYSPGLRRAIANEDLLCVRKLINQACFIRRDDVKITQAQELRGPHSSQTLLAGILPSMELLHVCMAGDVDEMKRMLSTDQSININFRNSGHHGYTSVYYVMVNNQIDAVDLLLRHGARLDISITKDNDDIPLLYDILGDKHIRLKTLKHVLSVTSPNFLARIVYKGRNIAAGCILLNSDPSLLEFILIKAGAVLLSSANSMGLSPVDEARTLDRTLHIEILEEILSKWCADIVNTSNRKHLALRGYPHLPNCDVYDTDGFISNLSSYQDLIEDLHSCVEENDSDEVAKRLIRGEVSFYFDPCLADSLTTKSWQPLLHKAVLRGNLDIVKMIGESIVYIKGLRIDDYYRTALHYAMALDNGGDIVGTLKNLGASENALDMNEFTPLDFQERKGLQIMYHVLEHHRSGNLNTPEPDWTKYSLPPPIIRYLTHCYHDNLSLELARSNLSDLRRRNHPGLPSIMDSQCQKSFCDLEVLTDRVYAIEGTCRSRKDCLGPHEAAQQANQSLSSILYRWCTIL